MQTLLPPPPEKELVGGSNTPELWKTCSLKAWTPASKAARSLKKNIWIYKWTQPAMGTDSDSGRQQESWADVQI